MIEGTRRGGGGGNNVAALVVLKLGRSGSSGTTKTSFIKVFDGGPSFWEIHHGIEKMSPTSFTLMAGSDLDRARSANH